MPSTLYRLYTYAKGTKAEARENFTTEALAAAIRQDPGPFVGALRGAGLLAYDWEPSAVEAQTQVGVPGAGIIDLDLMLEGPGWVHEYWIEVKVDSGESGTQLAAYQRVTTQLAHPPELVVLSKTRLPGHPSVPWLAWVAVWQAATTRASSPYWRDVAQLLQEFGMADEYDSPIVAREAASLLDAHALYWKTSRIVVAVLAEGKARWPDLGWPKTPNDADEQLLWQFKGRRRITLPVQTSGPARIFFGLAQHDSAADFDEREPHLCVWVEHSPKQVDLRRSIVEQADRGGLADHWRRRLQGWWALTAHERIGAFGGFADATTWVVARFEELEAAGVLALLAAPGGVSSPVVDEEPQAPV